MTESARPLIVRCGAFGDMVLITTLIRALDARFGRGVDLLTSGPWSRPLLEGQPGVADILSVRSRKMPYGLSLDQWRAVRGLRRRGLGPVWFCDGDAAAWPMIERAGIPADHIVDVRNHPLLPEEHATLQWARLSRLTPVAPGYWQDSLATARERAPASVAAGGATDGTASGVVGGAVGGTAGGGCVLDVSAEQMSDLDRWLRSLGLAGRRLLAVQIGNKRTMRRGFKRLAVNTKYWPHDRWADVITRLRTLHPEHDILMLGAGPEYRLNEAVRRLVGVERLHNAADALPIPRLVALLSRVDGLVTVDSGPAHAAAAVGCPLVVLFGKALPSLYRPWGTAGADVRVVVGRQDGEASMLGISVAQVMSAWTSLALRNAP